MSLATGDDLVRGVERDRAHHRTEDLLANHAHVVRRVGEDRRLHEITAIRGATAADDHLGARVLARIEVAQHLLELFVGDQGTHVGLGIRARTHLDPLREVGHTGDHVVVRILLDVQA